GGSLHRIGWIAVPRTTADQHEANICSACTRERYIARHDQEVGARADLDLTAVVQAQQASCELRDERLQGRFIQSRNLVRRANLVEKIAFAAHSRVAAESQV